MFYTKDLEGNIGEGRVGAFPMTSSAARVSTVSIGIDGVLSNHFSCLYREAVYASPSLLFSSSPEDTILQIAEGFVIGSEMSGGVRNVVASNCVFQGTDTGIRIKSQRGRGGVVEGVTISNIVMQDVASPFTITTFYGGSEKVTGTFRSGVRSTV